jgi:hypothetical protein
MNLRPTETACRAQDFRSKLDSADGLLFGTGKLIPTLRQIGVSVRDSRTMTVENPRSFLRWLEGCTQLEKPKHSCHGPRMRAIQVTQTLLLKQYAFHLDGPHGVYTPAAPSRGPGWWAMTS